MAKKPYQVTEKWWLILVVLFYALYNLPGFPAYGNAKLAIWHGVLTLVPLWVAIYWGLFRVFGQRKYADADHVKSNTIKAQEGNK